MTCIAAIVKDGAVYMAGDAACGRGYLRSLIKTPKVLQIGQFVMGFSGSARNAQILSNLFSPPRLPDSSSAESGDPLYRYMVGEFVNQLRATLKGAGCTTLKDASEGLVGGSSFLVGVRGRLFTIDSEFSVHEWTTDYSSVGCGEDFAMGALFATSSTTLEPKERLRLALEAAEAGSGFVQRPFSFVELEAVASKEAR